MKILNQNEMKKTQGGFWLFEVLVHCLIKCADGSYANENQAVRGNRTRGYVGGLGAS